MKCSPGKKDGRVSISPCFRCLRTPELSEKYDFVWYCADDIMATMSDEEVNELAKTVLRAIRENFSIEADIAELTLLGDCYARVLMRTIKHGNYLHGSYEQIPEVREVVQIAAERSMPAWGACSMMESTKLWKMPQCWVSMHQSWKSSI